jgi:hypothetical protein
MQALRKRGRKTFSKSQSQKKGTMNEVEKGRNAAGGARVMKAISIMQPWAWLIVNGHKDIENRDWCSNNPGLKYRGQVLIHTGLRFDEDFSGIGLPEIVRTMPGEDELPRGGIVGVAEIVDCVKDHPSPWFFGRYGFVLRDARPLDFRPCVRALGFFKPNYDRRYVEKPPKRQRVVKQEAPKLETMPLFGVRS